DPVGQAVLPISEFQFASISESSAIEESLSHLLERKDQTEISRCLPMAERNDSSTRTFASQDLLLKFSVEQIVAFVQVLTPNDPSALDMDALQVSQCFEDDSCIVCGTLESSLPSTWTSVQCHDTRPSTYMTISVQPPIGSRKIFEKLFLCGVEIIGRYPPPEFERIIIDYISQTWIKLTMEVNFPESYVEMTLTGINTTRSVSRQVNQDLILEHNFADLVPGTTYEITLEPRFEDLWGDQVKLKITTRLGELTFECFEILRNTSSKNENSENEDYEAEKTGNFENDLEKFANVKCLVSIDGRFDNITDTIEPPFSAQFQIFASNYLELDFTQLTPGETYRYSVNIKAGPWSLRSYQRVPTIPARPVLFLFKVYIDNTIELRFLLNGKGISFTYQIFDRNIIIATRVEAFEKYKFLIIDPKFYGMTLIAFVSTEEAVSDKAQRILKEISFFNVLSATIQRETDFYLSVAATNFAMQLLQTCSATTERKHIRVIMKQTDSPYDLTYMVSKPKLIGCTPYVYSAGQIPGHITCIWTWPKIEGVPTFEGYLENNEGQISRINS
ncbi:uncharacterized protein LOC142357204, partial [Convolutriloba macropyga]|uniref:uncharacterized protein LOC142357204 n=1 Tax=Convolutriloba macropyga TaxID=536237 RepID=UPI003F524FE1